MDSPSPPSYLLPTIIAIILIPLTLIFLSLRLFRYLFISMSLITYLSPTKKYTAVIESCVVDNRCSVGVDCKWDVVVFGVQMVVLVVGGMCCMAEAGERVGRMRVRARGQGSG
jgi:hypothetical protein